MIDAEARVCGTLPFAIDHRVEGMAHAVVVRSTRPHAKLEKVDPSAARELEGVIAVITGEDVAADDRVLTLIGVEIPDQPMLASDTVRFVGDPIAIVVAEDLDTAREAAFLVDIEYDDLPAVSDLDDAIAADAPLVHEDFPGNICSAWELDHGDADAAFAACDHILEDVYTHPSASHVPFEPQVAVAEWNGNELEIVVTSQSPYWVRKELARLFRLPQEKVVVRTFNLGGGFGAKFSVTVEPLAAFAALRVGRPVRIAYSREEVFLAIGKHASNVRMKTGFNSDGSIQAQDVEIHWNAGAYAGESPMSAGNGLIRSVGPYLTPNARLRSKAVYTNTVPSGPFRGAMTSQLCWAYESQLDEIAKRVGLTPVEIREKNLLREGDVHVVGDKVAGVHFHELLSEVVSPWADQAETESPSPSTGRRRVARGRGVGVTIKNTMAPSRSEAVVVIKQDGTCELLTSTIEMGQGGVSSLVSILAESLDIPEASIAVPFAKTGTTPYDTSTSSSRSIYTSGMAVHDAAQGIKRQMEGLYSEEKGPDVEFEHRDGGIGRKDSREDWISYGDLLKAVGVESYRASGAWESGGGLATLHHKNRTEPFTPHWHQGAAAAEVEVDLDYGTIRIIRMHVAAYAGRVVSRHRVSQQNKGCAIFGLGPTLSEEFVYENGEPLNPNFAEYLIPGFGDMPDQLTDAAVESSGDDAEWHGIGEMVVPAVAPAIGNAIYDAVGLRLKDLPLTAERVLAGLEIMRQQEGGKPAHG